MTRVTPSSSTTSSMSTSNSVIYHKKATPLTATSETVSNEECNNSEHRSHNETLVAATPSSVSTPPLPVELVNDEVKQEKDETEEAIIASKTSPSKESVLPLMSPLCDEEERRRNNEKEDADDSSSESLLLSAASKSASLEVPDDHEKVEEQNPLDKDDDMPLSGVINSEEKIQEGENEDEKGDGIPDQSSSSLTGAINDASEQSPSSSSLVDRDDSKADSSSSSNLFQRFWQARRSSSVTVGETRSSESASSSSSSETDNDDDDDGGDGDEDNNNNVFRRMWQGGRTRSANAVGGVGDASCAVDVCIFGLGLVPRHCRHPFYSSEFCSFDNQQDRRHRLLGLHHRLTNAAFHVRGGDAPSTSGNVDGAQGPSSRQRDVIVDSLARFVAITCAWIVAVQVIGAGLRSHRRNLVAMASRWLGGDAVAVTQSVRTIMESAEKEHGVINVFSKYPTKDVLASLYALSRLQRACQCYDDSTDQTKQQHPEEHSSLPFLTQELLMDLHRYAPYASATYGWKMAVATAGMLARQGDTQALILSIPHIGEEDVVHVQWDSKPNRPAYYIVRDNERQRIVLAIRGTWSAQDVLTDLVCNTCEYEVKGEQYKAHSGMLHAARNIATEALSMIEQELKDNPSFSLLLVGHSMGGGVASVLGNIWGPLFQDTTVYTYGPACAVPEEESGAAATTTTCVSVLSEGDPFSSLSLGHVADVSCLLAQLCESQELRKTIIIMTDGAIKKLDDRDLEWCHNTKTKMQQKFEGEKLYPPGRIVFLKRSASKKKRDRRCEAREVTHDFFADLRIGPSMFDLSKHIPRLYISHLADPIIKKDKSPEPNETSTTT